MSAVTRITLVVLVFDAVEAALAKAEQEMPVAAQA